MYVQPTPLKVHHLREFPLLLLKVFALGIDLDSRATASKEATLNDWNANSICITHSFTYLDRVHTTFVVCEH